MQLFEYPHIVITIFVLAFILLAAIGMAIAVRGMKIASGYAECTFTTIQKSEKTYKKWGKQSDNRSILFVNISSDEPRDLLLEKKLCPEIQTILLRTFSDGKTAFIARYDERNFVILTNWDNEALQQCLGKCQEELHACLLAHGALKVVNVRMGSLLAAGSQVTFDEAIKRAEQACMLAKNKENSYVQWDITSGKALEEKIKRENTIEKDIDDNRFFLEYQPILDAKTKGIIGAEVLARLRSESGDVLSPGRFLSAVDAVGINEKFDYYIFEKNCKWIACDKEKREKYRYTINFSRLTLSDPDFAEKIIGIVQAYELDASCLAIEILENQSLSDSENQQLITNALTLQKAGFSVLLDDFGSGCNNYGELQELSVSIVKIDKSITRKSNTPNGLVILESIIHTSHNLGAKVLCEGVERAEEEDVAIRAGCDYLQGFYYYKPMPVTEFEKLLDKG